MKALQQAVCRRCRVARAGSVAIIRRCQLAPIPASRYLSTADMSELPFEKILVANRGEIACRVIRTARRMGIKTVAVYSDIDDSALHVRMADEAVCIGKNPARLSYLDMDRVVEAVRATGAQAVHPGYGFLSENMAFAAKLEAAGVKFIGPPSRAIEAMGDKLMSKKIALDAKVNTIPGFKGVIETTEDAVRIAREIGYPVMMKASAGGGGKGMRIARSDKDVHEGFMLSKQEAMSSFGDDRMLVEKYIEDGHHIEIQIMADGHGNVVAFPERECSVQRRNQKVLEESPSCLLDEKTRRDMQDQAIRLARAVGYQSAGTVEMLCDKDLSFYFLEMNTRLQVEHPVTEAITGVDLVEQMINVAAGRPLSAGLLRSPYVPFCGHAIEARVYAEDPLRGFLPSTGPLVTYREPQLALLDPTGAAGTVMRIDAGVDEGSTVSMFYDPIISKLVTYGADRTQALRSMGQALDSYVIRGLGHNVAFLRDVCRNPRFAGGKYDTSFIPREYPEGFKGVQLEPREKIHLASLCALLHMAREGQAASISGQQKSYVPPELTDMVVVLGGPKGEAYHVRIDINDGEGTAAAVVRSEADPGNARRVAIGRTAWETESPLAYATMDGEHQALQYFGARGEGFDVAFAGSYQHVIVRSPLEHQLSRHMLPPVVVDHSRELRCPMPGAVVSLSVVEGQEVEVGQELAVVEAMKMQNVLRALQRARVLSVNCKPGDTLKVDHVMMEFERPQ